MSAEKEGPGQVISCFVR